MRLPRGPTGVTSGSHGQSRRVSDGWRRTRRRSSRCKRALHRSVKQSYAVAFCGRGRPAACRSALEVSLKKALAEKASDIYPADAVCRAGDQPCLDDVRLRPLGGVTQPLIPWINRPTYQQAVEVQGSSPR